MRLNFAMLSKPAQKVVGHDGTGGTPNSHAGLARPTWSADAWDTVGHLPGQMGKGQDEDRHLSHLSHLQQNEVGQAEHSVHGAVPRVPPVPPISEPNAAAGSFDREAFDERAAIMEFDGGMSRAEAEAAAALICGDLFRTICINVRNERTDS